jgi:4-alpha-glucanotransferase
MSFNNSMYDKKTAGILAPLFALRGKEDLGIGDTAALAEMIVWVAEHGFQALQMLPINETSSNNSPYEILSAMALEPSTITTHPDWLEDLTQEDYRAILERYDVEKMVEGNVHYCLVKKCKQELLNAAWSRFVLREAQDKHLRDYQCFQKEESYWLADYTLYRALLERHDNQEDFSTWNPCTQNADSAKRWLTTLPKHEYLSFEKRRDFFSYVQWIAITQWKKVFAIASSQGVLLIGDIPTGVHVASADVFSKSDLFDIENLGGAPSEKIFQSDPFTMRWGQNWGIPLYKWDSMEKDNFQWWRHRIRFLRSFFHILRIDHALGLFRIYSFPWPPKMNDEFMLLTQEEALKKTEGILPHFVDYADDTPEHASYNKERGSRLLSIFQQEAGKYQLIAEDLGEVPPYVPDVLKKLEIPGFKIPLWIRDKENKMIPARDYPIISVATYATHDHHPFRKQWEMWQHDIREKKSLAPGAEKTIRELLFFIDLPDLDSLTPYEGKIHQALLKTLYESGSWLVIVMITDLLGLKQIFNNPGNLTSSNWVARIPLSIDSWNEKHTNTLASLDKALQESGRFRKL